MKKVILFLVAQVVSFQLLAAETDYVGQADYSRTLIKSLAVSYMAGALSQSTESFKSKVDEIVVNDNQGTQKYSVEVFLKSGGSYDLTFSGVEVVGVELED